VGPPAGLVDRNDSGVFKVCGDKSLATETDLADVVARDELLDGDITPQIAVIGARDATQATTAMLIDDLISARVTDLRGSARAFGQVLRSHHRHADAGSGCR